MEQVETIIIGGGQAGLAMSYYLRALDREHVVLERARVAERWRTERWDSLRFQFPSWSIELPGYCYAGDNPDAFVHRDEVVRFIEGYAQHIQAPLRAGVNVLALRPALSAGRYLVLTDQGSLESCNVVIATGPYQRPQVPALAGGLPVDLVQLHASAYRHPTALPAGAVLVVGSGSSGCQIAEELLEAGRAVYLSVSRHRRTPRRYRGRDMFWWARALGYHDQTADAVPAAQRPLPPLITGAQGGHDVDFRRLVAAGMTLLGRVVDIREGQLTLARDLEANLGSGDQGLESFKDAVDSYIRTTGFDAPPEDRMRALPTAARDSVGTLDLHAAAISSVIWATGYSLDFSWVELPIFDAHGYPLHHRGVTTAPGVYVLGLRWLHKLKSAFLCGVGEDAGYLAEQIAKQRAWAAPC